MSSARNEKGKERACRGHGGARERERASERASERERRRESGLVRKGFVIKRSRTRCRNAFVVHRLSARFDLDT